MVSRHRKALPDRDWREGGTDTVQGMTPASRLKWRPFAGKMTP